MFAIVDFDCSGENDFFSIGPVRDVSCFNGSYTFEGIVIIAGLPVNCRVDMALPL